MQANYSTLYSQSMEVPPEWLPYYRKYNPPIDYPIFETNYTDTSKVEIDKSKYGTFNYYDEHYIGCDSAYSTLHNEMVFRNVNELENLNQDPNRATVLKQIDMLDKQYKGEKSNMRFIQPREYRRTQFAKDHTTMSPH